MPALLPPPPPLPRSAALRENHRWGRIVLSDLDYYYLHGYQIINPLCRILDEHPGIWHWVKFRSNRSKQIDSLFIFILGRLNQNRHAMQILQLDDYYLNTLLKNAPSKENNLRNIKIAFDTAPSEEKSYSESCRSLRETLGSILAKIDNIGMELSGKPRTQARWVFRGDGASILHYFKALIPKFCINQQYATAIDLNYRWCTNQFFSTSTSRTLASVAERKLIWIIRTKDSGTDGAVGGAYLSEGEVLFPFKTAFTLRYSAVIRNRAQISHLKLTNMRNGLDVLRIMEKVYECNFADGSPVRFLVATEGH